MAQQDALRRVFRCALAEAAERLPSAAADSPELLAELFTALSQEPSASAPEPGLVECVRHAVDLSGLGAGLGAVAARIRAEALEALEEDGPGAFPGEVAIWAPGGGPRRASYTARQCRGVLANALLSNVQDTTAEVKAWSGGLYFRPMLRGAIGASKLACLLRYFAASGEEGAAADDEREVVFERRCPAPEHMELSHFKAWILQRDDEATSPNCELHGGRMEDIAEADAFVNFANANFGYGRFIPSCTQEEIMQMCCPEFNVGMLHQGCMKASEVVVAHNVRRFSAYTGYADTFRFAGPWTGAPLLQSILTMDAVMGRHFSEDAVLRDVRKAYLAFQGCRLVSTGRWGCGVFGGHPPHKLLQQALAARLAGCELRFSCFGSPDGCDVALDAARHGEVGPARLLTALLAASARRGRVVDFERVFAEVMAAPGAAAAGAAAADGGTCDVV